MPELQIANPSRSRIKASRAFLGGGAPNSSTRSQQLSYRTTAPIERSIFLRIEKRLDDWIKDLSKRKCFDGP
jgi:hypothetical protein